MQQPSRIRFVLFLSLAQFLAWGSGFYVFAAVIEAVERDLDLPRQLSGLAFSVALLVEGAAGYAVGLWIDKGREHLAMTCGALLLAGGLALQAASNSALAFVAACGFTGLGFAACLYMPAFVVLARRFPSDYRGATMGLTLFGGLASTAFIPLCSYLATAVGWRWTLGAMALLNVMVTGPLLWWTLIDRSPVPAQLVKIRHSTLPPAARLPAFKWALCFSVLATTVAAAIPPHIVAIVREAGAPDAWCAWLPALIGVAQSASRLLFLGTTRASAKGNWDLLLAWIVPASLLAYLVADSLWMLGAFVVLYGAGNGIVTILRGLIVADRVSNDDVGALNGLIGVPSAIGRGIAPWMLAALWNAAAGYRIGMAVLLGLACTSAIALALTYRVRPA